ncbi:hypothetical protein Daqu01_01726 [Deinococcus aquaticus]
MVGIWQATHAPRGPAQQDLPRHRAAGQKAA